MAACCPSFSVSPFLIARAPTFACYSDHYRLPSGSWFLIGTDVDGGESERRRGPASVLIGYGCELCKSLDFH